MLTIRPTGIPVQAATVWATPPESTQGNMSGFSACTSSKLTLRFGQFILPGRNLFLGRFRDFGR